MTERCELSELPVDGCFHCTSGARNLGPMMAEFLDAGSVVDE